MATFKTPGVYIQEISTLPASVAGVETAIPAFIGYTEKAVTQGGKDLTNRPTRVGSLLEFELLFGAGAPYNLTAIVLDDNDRVITTDAAQEFYNYDAIRMFYANGGGDCYMISIGDYGSTPAVGDFTTGLAALKKEDEPTLILSPDAVFLDAGDLASFQQACLAQCERLQDRFSIFDIQETGDFDQDVQDFRDNIGIVSLKYGAAYVPYLKTNLERDISYKDFKNWTGAAYESVITDAFGAPLSLKNLKFIQDLPNVAPTFLRTQYEDAIDDLEFATSDCLGTGDEVDTFLAAPGATRAISFVFPTLENLRQGYNLLVEEFNTQIAAADLTASRSAFVDAITYALNVANQFLDIWAGIGTTLSSPILEAYVQDAIDTELKDTFMLNIVKIINTSQDVSASPYNAPFGAFPAILPDYSWSYADWAGTFASAAGLDPTVLPTPAPPGGGAGNAPKMANMVTVMPLVTAAFAGIMSRIDAILAEAESELTRTQANLEQILPPLANMITLIREQLAPLPPSGAVAGLYAFVDSTRGVWKAPANVSVNSTTGLTQPIDNNDQERLNVDVTGGKSINAIRFFEGKGNLVWGAGTLAGNDNEWRYVPVRRLFIYTEESIKKATEFVVFEPNDRNTWLKVKGMIENFLTGLWRDGALAGAKPADAFFVKVGLGETMTSTDILEGRLIVEIGMAAVRPAEFIILKFMHKLQES